MVAIALLMWWLMYPILAWRTTAYELTTRRLRLRDGIVTRNGRDIPLSRITDVSFRKGVLDRLLGCGTLVVESAGEHGELTLTEIPHVERLGIEFLAACKGEHALRQRRAALGRLNGVGDERHASRIVQRAFAHQLETAEHRHQ